MGVRHGGGIAEYRGKGERRLGRICFFADPLYHSIGERAHACAGGI